MTDASLPAAAGPVRLCIPPDAALSRVLRMMVGAMASIGAFTLDEIDDVKIAMSEVLIALIEHGDQSDVLLQSHEVVEKLLAANAIEGVSPDDVKTPTLKPDWEKILADLDVATTELKEIFLR